ncbi:MAG: type III-A CRISPR-associated protein Cas10/Csm1 [Thermoprotei archaeon]|nr:MAG: type III-A CRISPR-associated protein Cas10/Csm1 [Thermoprotei archaeon]
MFDPKEYWTLVFSALLHDIGKVEQRSMRRRINHVNASVELIAKYSSLFEKLKYVDVELLKELIGSHHLKVEEVKASIKKLLNILKEADKCSAAERGLGDEVLQISKPAIIKKLVSILWIKDFYETILAKNIFEKRDAIANEEAKYIDRLLNQPICYEPYLLVKLSPEVISNPEEYRYLIKHILASKCTKEYRTDLYGEIYSTLLDRMNRLLKYSEIGLFDEETLYITLSSLIKPLLLYVPDAIYGVRIPSTSLTGHLITTASLAQAFYRSSSRKYRLLGIDVSGIQAYLKKIARQEGSLRQIRGRSLIIQLLTRAVTNYIVRKLGLDHVSILCERGGIVDLIIPDIDGLEKKVLDIHRKLDEYLLRTFHGDLYVSIAFSSPVEECDYEEPWSPNYLKCGFAKAINELAERLNIVKMRRYSSLDISSLSKCTAVDKLVDQSITEYLECDECRINMPKKYLLTISDPAFRSTLHLEENVVNICESCLYAQIAGTAASNLTYVIEIINDKLTKNLYGELVKKVRSSLTLKTEKIIMGIIPFDILETTYIIVSKRSPELSDDIVLATILDMLDKEILDKYLGKEDRTEIIIYKVNDLANFIPKPIPTILEKLDKIRKYGNIAFSYMFTNFTVKESNIDEIAKKVIKTETTEYTLLAWLKSDIDRMGEIGLVLSGSPGRYLTLVELINFFTGLIAQMLLNIRSPFEKEVKLANTLIAVYSGGDDTFVIGRFIEALKYVQVYQEFFKHYFGTIDNKPLLTQSTGLILTGHRYPAYLGYSDVLEHLSRAKNDGRNRIALPISPNIEYRDNTIICMSSIDWQTYHDIFSSLVDKELVEIVSSDKSLFYRLYFLLLELVDTVCSLRNAAKIPPTIVSYITSYVYIFRRHEDILRKFIDRLRGHIEIRYCLPEEIVKASSLEEVITNLSKLAIVLSQLLLISREGYRLVK